MSLACVLKEREIEIFQKRCLFIWTKNKRSEKLRSMKKQNSSLQAVLGSRGGSSCVAFLRDDKSDDANHKDSAWAKLDDFHFFD